MALGASLPPWLTPPNFLGAMEAGASTGLRARQQDIEEYQAADRLKLAYDQLAKQERVASMQALAKQKQGEAALALRAAIAQQGMDLRERSLQQQGDLRSRALDLQQQQQGSLLDLKKSEDQTRQDEFKARMEQGNRRINPDGTVTVYDPVTKLPTVVGTPKPKEEKPESKGTLHLDAQGNVTGASGPPGSEAVKGVLEQAQHRKMISSLPKPHFLGGKKLSKDQAKMFLDAAGGDKEKATQLATEAGWTE